MLELKKNSLQQISQSIQKQFSIKNEQLLNSNEQMPVFQISFFINQAIEKHKLISVSYTDYNSHVYNSIGFISKNKKNSTIFKLDEIGNNLSHLFNISQIKYIKLVKI